MNENIHKCIDSTPTNSKPPIYCRTRGYTMHLAGITASYLQACGRRPRPQPQRVLQSPQFSLPNCSSVRWHGSNRSHLRTS